MGQGTAQYMSTLGWASFKNLETINFLPHRTKLKLLVEGFMYKTNLAPTIIPIHGAVW